MNLSFFKLLNNHDIHYGVGGSLMLKQMGFDVTPHDVDIVVHERDILKVVKLLSECAILQPPIESGAYLTKHFFRFVLNETHIDIITNFAYAHDEGHYHALFDKISIVKTSEIDGLTIPLMSLEEWYVIYQIMKRDKQIFLIEEYWKKNGIEYPDLLERQLTLNIPHQIKLKIESLINKTINFQ
jgi:hypothetical protein